MKFAAIADWADQDDYPVAFMCEQLEVSRSGYYAWRGAQPSATADADARFTALIISICAKARGNPGVRRVLAGLAALGHRLGHKRVWRLMKTVGLQRRHPKAWKRTTLPGEHPVPAPDLIERAFTAATVNEKWCGDITYIKTWDGWAYLATVIDLHSQALVGWAIADHMRTELVTDAPDMAIAARPPAAGVIFHSDRGTQGGFQWSSQHLQGARPVLHQQQHPPLPGKNRHLLRQCRLRVILRHLQERTHPHPPVAEPQSSKNGDYRLDRKLLQHSPASFHTRILDTRRIRTRLQKHQRLGSLISVSEKAGTLQTVTDTDTNSAARRRTPSDLMAKVL